MPHRAALKAVMLIVLLGFTVWPTASTSREPPFSNKPNILFILTDDLDSRSDGRMINLRELVKKQGITFSNAFVTTPLCCPSRASILTGKYAHNHTVYTNAASNGAPKFHASGEDESTAATWLDSQGYETIMIGKYMNHYDGTYIPPGWDHWHGQMGFNNDHQYNHNGTIRLYEPERYHDTDLFSDWATYYIRRGAGKEVPFFMYLAVNAPHGPDDGAPRHESAYKDVRLPRSPSFNEEDVSDKPPWVRNQPPLDSADVEELAQRHRDRLRSLLSADEMIGQLVEELRGTGELENTYIFFTSDNGFHLGQHRMHDGKATAYEEDIRVPLYVRGPGVPAGRTLTHKVLNIDLAPTFAELSEATMPAATIDGRSFVPLLGDTMPPASAWRELFLVEFFKQHPYSALRSGGYTYVEYDNGMRELYDLKSDPYQLESLHESTGHQALMKTFHTRLEALESCSGQTSCKAAESEMPEPSGVPAAGEVSSRE